MIELNLLNDRTSRIEQEREEKHQRMLERVAREIEEETRGEVQLTLDLYVKK